MSLGKILLVDDDLDILEFIKYNLDKEGYETTAVDSGEKAIALVQKTRFELVVLDVMMPLMDGIETCEKIRTLENGTNAIVIFLTARGEDYSHIAGFDAGADDYITKPIKPKVFVSKINALLRREKRKEGLSDDPGQDVFRVDREQYLIYRENEEFSLPKKEFELAALLIAKPGKVFGRETILNSVWGEGVIVGDRTIDVHMRKIREKLGKEYFKTIQGVGYKYIQK